MIILESESDYLKFKRLYKESKEAYEKYESMYKNKKEDKQYRKYMLTHQFDIPRKIDYIARGYGDVLTYNQITNLYKASVNDVLNIHNIECVIDLPFGQGLREAQLRWEEKLGEAKKKVIENEQLERIGL